MADFFSVFIFLGFGLQALVVDNPEASSTSLEIGVVGFKFDFSNVLCVCVFDLGFNFNISSIIHILFSSSIFPVNTYLYLTVMYFYSFISVFT